MKNIIWLNKQNPCVVCGWLTYTSLDGEHHVCNDVTCTSMFRTVYADMNSQVPAYEDALRTEEIKEHMRDYHPTVSTG